MDWVREILYRYGQEAALRTAEGERPIRAFLQPLAEKGEQVPGVATSIGWIDERLWLYLGREMVEPGDTVVWNGMAFQVRSSRPYFIGQTLTHWWAMLEWEREAV